MTINEDPSVAIVRREREAKKVKNRDAGISYRHPRYQTGDRLYTREDLLQLFTRDWGPSIHAGDVDSFIKRWFWDASAGMGKLVPTDMIPFPPIVLDESLDDKQRDWAINAHEERRRTTRRARELFRIDGLPVFVPQHQLPSMGDSKSEQYNKIQKIESL